MTFQENKDNAPAQKKKVVYFDVFFCAVGLPFSTERFLKMAARTYQPELVILLQRISKYLARWTPYLLPHMTTVEASALLAFQAALTELIHQLTPEEGGV